MNSSQHRSSEAHLADVRSTIERLEALVRDDPKLALPQTERAAVDRALLHSLELLTTDEAVGSLVARFGAATSRRPALVGDVLITLRLIEQGLIAL